MERFNEPSKAIEELSPKDNYLHGTFYFSNNSEKEFSAYWNSVKYTFPAKTASPMVILDETPQGVQNIRKRFAQKWAEENFFRSDKYESMMKDVKSSLSTPVGDILEPLIQMCLSPLPVVEAAVKQENPVPRVVERSKPTIKRTRPVKDGTSAKKILDDEEPPTDAEVGTL